MGKHGFLLMITFLVNFSTFAQNSVYQWSVPINSSISTETKDHPQAYLWIPENCKYVRGVIFGQHNMLEEGIMESPEFRKSMAKLGFAEIWVTPALDMIFDFNKDAEKAFNEMMASLATVSGYPELNIAPIVPIGHSAAASFPWNFTASNPNRTLAAISIKGDAPQTNLTGSGKPNPDWGDKNFDGVPAMMVMGEYEWWEDRLKPGLAYLQQHPNTPLTWYADAGHSHFDYSKELVTYFASYIEKAAKYRLPKHQIHGANVVLKPVNLADGWLMDRWRKDAPLTAKAAPFKKYEGDRTVASWCFDKQMVKQTIKRYDAQRGKKTEYIGFTQNGNLVMPQKSHAVFNINFQPLEDGISFSLKSAFTDSTRTKLSDNHADGKLTLNRICGPIKKLNDTTFQIEFHRLGFNNPKRSNEVWMIASASEDKDYKATEQQLTFRFPLFNKDGRAQSISFPIIKNQSAKTKSLVLNANSTSGLPIYYYVKEGPGYMKDNKIFFTKIPPKSKLPVKITVVAWQYGKSVGEKVQSAEPIERIFYLGR